MGLLCGESWMAQLQPFLTDPRTTCVTEGRTDGRMGDSALSVNVVAL